MWYEARKRAIERGVPFDIEKSDLIIPDVCPVFGHPFIVGAKGSDVNWAPSLDAIIPERGYVRGNIQIISRFANLMKNKVTPTQLTQFAEWVLQTCRP